MTNLASATRSPILRMRKAHAKDGSDRQPMGTCRSWQKARYKEQMRKEFRRSRGVHRPRRPACRISSRTWRHTCKWRTGIRRRAPATRHTPCTDGTCMRRSSLCRLPACRGRCYLFRCVAIAAICIGCRIGLCSKDSRSARISSRNPIGTWCHSPHRDTCASHPKDSASNHRQPLCPI